MNNFVLRAVGEKNRDAFTIDVVLQDRFLIMREKHRWYIYSTCDCVHLPMWFKTEDAALDALKDFLGGLDESQLGFHAHDEKTRRELLQEIAEEKKHE